MSSENKIYKLNTICFSPETPAVLYISNGNFGEKAEDIADAVKKISKIPFSMFELQVNDWDRFLTPWPAESGSQDRTFYGGGMILLKEIENNVLPKIKALTGEKVSLYLAGYSLAGLFSLWAQYENAGFSGAASCSGSLWYPGWLEYIHEKKLENSKRVYLSLGRKEERTKHVLMKEVGNNTRLQYEKMQLETGPENTQLTWHDGGHFTNVKSRIAEGICWLIS